MSNLAIGGAEYVHGCVDDYYNSLLLPFPRHTFGNSMIPSEHGWVGVEHT